MSRSFHCWRRRGNYKIELQRVRHPLYTRRWCWEFWRHDIGYKVYLDFAWNKCAALQKAERFFQEYAYSSR